MVLMGMGPLRARRACGRAAPLRMLVELVRRAAAAMAVPPARPAPMAPPLQSAVSVQAQALLALALALAAPLQLVVSALQLHLGRAGGMAAVEEELTAMETIQTAAAAGSTMLALVPVLLLGLAGSRLVAAPPVAAADLWLKVVLALETVQARRGPLPMPAPPLLLRASGGSLRQTPALAAPVGRHQGQDQAAAAATQREEGWALQEQVQAAAL